MKVIIIQDGQTTSEVNSEKPDGFNGRRTGLLIVYTKLKANEL